MGGAKLSQRAHMRWRKPRSIGTLCARIEMLAGLITRPHRESGGECRRPTIAVAQ